MGSKQDPWDQSWRSTGSKLGRSRRLEFGIHRIKAGGIRGTKAEDPGDQSWRSTSRSSNSTKNQVNFKENPLNSGSWALSLTPGLFGGGQLLSLGLSHLWDPGLERSPRGDSLASGAICSRETRTPFHLFQPIMSKINHLCKPSPRLDL